jgi:hypothetical protein
MKTSKAQKTTTVSVGDGPPRIVPLDKEDEYASGETHHPALCLHLFLPPFLSILPLELVRDS